MGKPTSYQPVSDFATRFAQVLLQVHHGSLDADEELDDNTR